MAKYVYDADGQRIQKTVDGVRTSYVYDRGRVSFEKNASGGITVKYLNGLSCHGENRDLETYYYFTNAHGDVTVVVDSGRDMTDVFKYDEFGGITFETHDPDSIALTSFRYANEYYDTETGNYYLRSRYYDPSIDRFTQADTFAGSITDPLSLNLYTYCHNNPINYVDPSGHYAISVGGNEYIFRDDLTDEEMREISYRSMYLGNGEISIEEYISSTAAYGVSVNFNGGEPSPYDASSGRVPLEKVDFYGSMTATNIGYSFGVSWISEAQGIGAIETYSENAKKYLSKTETQNRLKECGVGLTCAEVLENSINDVTHKRVIEAYSEYFDRTGESGIAKEFNLIDISGLYKAGKVKAIVYDVPLYYQGNTELCWAYAQVMYEEWKRVEEGGGSFITQEEAEREARRLAVEQFGEINWNQPAMIFGVSSTKNDLTNVLDHLARGPVYARFVYFLNDTYVGHFTVVTGAIFAEGYDNLILSNNSSNQQYVQTFREFKELPKIGGDSLRFDCFYIPQSK